MYPNCGPKEYHVSLSHVAFRPSSFKDFTLKAPGMTEFFDGHTSFINFASVRQMYIKNKLVELILCKRSTDSAESNDFIGMVNGICVHVIHHCHSSKLRSCM
jgi:hypothetical protein